MRCCDKLSRLLIFIALTASTAAAPSAIAENAYRWTDKNGRTMYGGKPPAGARNVEILTPKTYSKYSSSKLISGYGIKQKFAPTSQPKATKVEESAQTSEPAQPEPKPTHDIDIPEPAQLDHGTVELQRNDKGQVASCSVKVKNYGGEKAGTIKVSFQFPDGTLIQATGPETLAAGAEVEYKIASNSLPLTLRGKQTQSSDAKPDSTPGVTAPEVIADVTPEVLIDFNSLPN